MGLFEERTVLALASAATAAAPPEPYATPLYFASLPGPPPLLVFVSDPATTHGQHVGAGPTSVAGCVFAEHTQVDQLRGVQFRGLCCREPVVPPSAISSARTAYLQRHPVAAPVLERSSASVYIIALTWAKATDNRVAFGHKQSWAFRPPAWLTSRPQ